LAATLTQPDKWWYLSELAQFLKTTPSSLQRPLAGLIHTGVVTARPDGNRLYYAADLSHPVVPELKGLLAKTSGVAGIIRDAFARVAPKVRFAFVYGSVAAGTEGAASDVDLLVVGQVGLNDLALPLRKATERLGREVNPTVYSEREFKAKIHAGNRFLRGVLDKPKLFVIGTAHNVEEVTG
jgi:predicted nucleotidyltransferase